MVYDLIIIGGGPAGMTAGIYTGRQRLKTLVITKDFGGQIARKAVLIENFPGFEAISGEDLISKFKNHLQKQKIEIKIGSVARIEKTEENFSVIVGNNNTKKTFQAKVVIIASGADPRPLEIPGEKEFLGRGLSYCPLCDGPLFQNKTVAVVGGGNAGFEAAIFLTKIAKKVYILEYSEKVRADAENQERVKKMGKVEIITNVHVQKIEGARFLNSLIFEDRKTGKEKTLTVEGIFVEIGSQPATSFVKDLVDFNERDEIEVDFKTFQTKTPGLFAVGDVNVGKYKQIVTACGEGAKAALAAYDYLQKQK